MELRKIIFQIANVFVEMLGNNKVIGGSIIEHMTGGDYNGRRVLVQADTGTNFDTDAVHAAKGDE